MPNLKPDLIRMDEHFKSLPELPFIPTLSTIKDQLKYPVDTNNLDFKKFNIYIDTKTPDELMTFYNEAKYKNIGNIRTDIKRAMRILDSELGLKTDSRSESIGEGLFSHLVDDDDDELHLSSLRVEPSRSGRLVGGRRKSKKHKGSKKRRRKSMKKSRRKRRKSIKY